MKLSKLVIVAVIMAIIIAPATQLAEALQSDTVIVGGSANYDGEARVWGRYITWRRGIDTDVSGVIDYDEPSWIMVHDLSTDLTWNITPPDPYTNSATGGLPWHADNPNIYNGRIIYEYMYTAGATSSRIAMHNITANETWLTVPTQVLNTNAFGHYHRIYGDWLIWTHRSGSHESAFIMNWRTPDEHLWMVKGTHLDTVTYTEMNDKYALFSIYNTATLNYRVLVLNLTSMGNFTIDFTGDRAPLIASGIDDEIVSLYSKDVRYELQIVDISNLTVGTTYNWTTIQDNILAERGVTGNDLVLPMLSGVQVAYMIEVPGSQPDIQVWNYQTNSTVVLTSNPSRQYLFDFQEDKVIYHDNTFSSTQNNDHRDDFDVYRTLQDTEAIFNSFMAIVPIIFIGFLVVAIVGFVKVTGGT